ncbi:MAG: DUF5715 family protein, partial [Pseudohongiellaceae bacterium]
NKTKKQVQEDDMQRLTMAFVAATVLFVGAQAQAQTLRGSSASMQRQNQEAISYGYTFIETPQTVSRFVDAGDLVAVHATASLDFHDVSFPYARPAVKLFLERLSAQYRAACGEKLVVTSLTRPIARQPVNAASNSVHPTGMAADLRIPSKGSCRSWLEGTLLSLEGSGVLDVTRERYPPHYHVAVFTQTYRDYVASMTGESREYRVRRGDSLSRIASRSGISVAQLRRANGLSGDLIRVGQTLQIPGNSVVAGTASATEVAHRVQRGETLWRISKRYDTSVNLLREENGLTDDFLQVGQVLRISTAGAE